MKYSGSLSKTKNTFDQLNHAINQSKYKDVIHFFNLGYIPTLNSSSYSAFDLPAFAINKNAIRLVLEVIAYNDLNDKTIIDIGCGRGGTLSIIKQYFNPQKITGVDISETSIAYCRESFKAENAGFICGEASNIDMKGGYADMIFIIELMNATPYILKVYKEVFRLLKPGGSFQHAGIFPNRYYRQILSFLTNHFHIVQNRDVTENILLSCQHDSSSRRQALTKVNSDVSMDDFLITPQNITYEMLLNKQASYRIFNMTKDEMSMIP